MLFTYPVEATEDNWLHDCLTDLLYRGMDAVDTGQLLQDWPDCLPAEKRERLRRFTELSAKHQELLASYRALASDERARVREAIDDQGALQELYEGHRVAARTPDLPDAVREPVRRFFDKAFDMLKPLGIRDANYRRFVERVEHKVCAFCGCEFFSGAGSKREPLDHYLAISLYPFAGANARNLVPMGSRCNSLYKRAQDVLRDQAGQRRRCFDPYAATPVTVSLMGTRLFAREGGLPEWRVDFLGDAARIATWDAVFEIRSRLASDHLDSLYKNSLKVFGKLWQKRRTVLGDINNPSAAFDQLAELHRQKGMSGLAFLETALYEMLSAKYAAGGAEADRLKAEYVSATLIVE